MELEIVRDYGLAKPGTTEDFPFDEEVLVFRVMGKIYLLTNIEQQDPASINLKCDPDRAIELRAQYDAVTPGYHMNKKHWNTMILNGSIPEDEVWALIDHSYALVAKGLKRADRDALAKLLTRQAKG